MPGGKRSEFFPSPPATVSDRKAGEIIKGFPKGKNKFFAAIFICIIFSTLQFFKHPNASKFQKTKKTKRDITTSQFNDYQTDIEMYKNDVEIIPENRRTYEHPNHKYAEDKIQEETVNESNGWFSKSFASKTHKYPNNIQDVILKGKLGDQSVKGQNRFLNEMMKVSGSSMRLKGVYKQSRLPGSQFDENYHYSKEINNLMQNKPVNGVKVGKRLTRNSFRGLGVPFRLPPKGRENSKRQKQNFRLDAKLKKHPITIYLDFFPINLQENRKIKSNSNVSESEFPEESVNVGTFLPPRRKYGGMIMKLNLYPRGFRRKSAGGPHPLKYSEKAERKSFGWFSMKKKKKNHQKECSFVGLNPNERHITAKWKDENGEWVHAEHVAVKYLKKENESNKT